MPTRKQSIDTFERNMDELIACKYVLSKNKITELLRGISQSRLFMELFEFCVEGFDYQAEKSKYFSESPAFGEKRFFFPSDKKVAIALIFTLLFEIDGGRQDFIALLSDYFNEGTPNKAYKRFTDEVFIPFKALVLEVAKAMSKTEFLPQEDTTTEVVPVKKSLLSSEDIATINKLLDQSKGVILQYKIDDDLKTDLICLYDFFRQAMYDGDIERIKAAYLGFKYGIMFHRRSDSGVEKIGEILKKDGIL